ncbi:MAG: YeeE/YedE family protein [Nevskiales bacterium]|nr:YeeE/YedE family protein [Nevskiales bacterium]
MKALIALGSGLLFGVGLSLGGMTDPAKVIAFLDLGGQWDPTLAFVMGGALLLTTPTFRWLLRLKRPMFEQSFYIPTKNDVDSDLVIGSALFGIGWGIAGLCPGPAVVAMYTGAPKVLAFVAAMVAGMWLRDQVALRRHRRQLAAAPQSSPADLSRS